MEKTFRRMIDRPGSRNSYVKAEVTTALAHQIRALRIQRGWTQKELANHLETTQAAISRLEDPSYGKVTLQTLFSLSKVFDVGLSVKFVSLVNMINETFIPDANSRRVEPFETEVQGVGFVCNAPTSVALELHSEPIPMLQTMVSSQLPQSKRFDLAKATAALTYPVN